jgi:hypothetical protein
MEGQVPSEGQVVGSVDELIGSTTERVQAVLEAAERAAEGIIKDAEAEAERQLAESRARAEQLVRERSGLAGQLTDDLLERAATIKEQSDQLITALQHAIDMLEAELAADSEAAAGAVAADTAVEPDSATAAEEPDVPGSGPRGRRGGLAAVPADHVPSGFGPSVSREGVEPSATDRAKAARLLATQMAVAGASREEIERRLRTEFGIDDPATILDAVSGRGER